jgi:hypothetical protein
MSLADLIRRRPATATPATSATPAVQATAPVASVATVAVAAKADDAAEARRQRVLDMLAARPGIRYAVITDADADSEVVILTLAIRAAMADGSTVTCELRIPRDKYDPFLLLDLVARHGGSAH